MMNRHTSLLIVAVLAIGIATLASSTQGQEVTNQPIIVLGEVQSAANTVAAFLEHLDLIDSEHHWSGGDTILIQMGDLIDDGEHVRAALDLFMKLEEEAVAAGGQVIVLMGNHEALNILGELRDVNPMAYQSFAGPDSEQRQRQAWEEWSGWRKARAEAVGETFEADAEAEQAWYASHPPGWVEYVESMRPEGVYGAWLRSLPVAVEINDVLFVHGGLNQEIEDKNVASINRRAAEEIKSFDDYREHMVGKGLCLPTSAAGEMVNVINQEAAYINGLDDSERTTSNPRVATLARGLRSRTMEVLVGARRQGSALFSRRREVAGGRPRAGDGCYPRYLRYRSNRHRPIGRQEPSDPGAVRQSGPPDVGRYERRS